MPNRPTGIATQVFILSSENNWTEALDAAATALVRGELVAFPTETVYGLGANALNSSAVADIFAAKGRPADNPLIVHVPDVNAVAELVSYIPPVFPDLAAAFWPGPLTLVLPRAAQVPDVTTGGLDTVAIRIPAHPVALALLRTAGVPVAAPSANRSGRPSPTQAEHVLADLYGQVAVVLNGGPAGVGVESTVLDLTSAVPTVLRPGGVTLEQIAAVIGEVHLDPRATALPQESSALQTPVRSPGMKYKHYAPVAPTVLVEGVPPYLWQKLHQLISNEKPKHPGLLLTTEGMQWFQEHGLPAGCTVALLGERSCPAEAARLVFSALRQMDVVGADRVYIEGIADTGVGLAVMNRLRRAAGGHIVWANPD